MAADIATRKDIDGLLAAFYEKAIKDGVIGFYFTEVVPLKLDDHLPVIGDFWESVLFGTDNYHGNPIKIHQHIHQLSPFNAAHFDQWVKLFCATADQLFEGENTERIKQRAASIATVMKIKLLTY